MYPFWVPGSIHGFRLEEFSCYLLMNSDAAALISYRISPRGEYYVLIFDF